MGDSSERLALLPGRYLGKVGIVTGEIARRAFPMVNPTIRERSRVATATLVGCTRSEAAFLGEDVYVGRPSVNPTQGIDIEGIAPAGLQVCSPRQAVAKRQRRLG